MFIFLFLLQYRREMESELEIYLNEKEVEVNKISQKKKEVRNSYIFLLIYSSDRAFTRTANYKLTEMQFLGSMLVNVPLALDTKRSLAWLVKVILKQK